VESPRAWVLTIAHRKALDHHRARARRPVPVGAVPDVPAPDTAGAGGDVWDRVRHLPPKQRAALLLRFAGDLSHRDVAVALGCSEEAARRSAHEGLKRLREELAA
jgi:DNA-directed RNA polymerase specialized sigma24 family protein